MIRHNNRSGAILIAPYSPPGRTMSPHLGAANKIGSVARILSSQFGRVVLINTAHNNITSGPLTITTHNEFGPQIQELTPQTFTGQKIGKLRHLFQIREIVDHASFHVQPECIWTYNAYATDGACAIRLKDRFPQSQFVTQIEDWPGTRHRGSISGWAKDTLDRHSLMRCITRSDIITVVNSELPSRFKATGRIVELPCILHPMITNGDTANNRMAVGYFGGMNTEKGFNVILDALRGGILDQTCHKWVLCGDGPMLNEAMNVGRLHPDRVAVFHGLSQPQLYQLMKTCRFIINPHKPLGGGIFPFKVFESIAIGAIVISTQLPNTTLDVSPATIPFNGTPSDLAITLREANQFTNHILDRARKTQIQVAAQFSETNIKTSLFGI